MTRHYILNALRDIMLEHIREPRWGLREDEFLKRSDTLWSVDEAIAYARRSNLPPEEALLEFARKCQHFAKYEKTRDSFITAMYTAATMADIVRAMT